MSVALRLLGCHQLEVGICVVPASTYQVGSDVIIGFNLEICIARLVIGLPGVGPLT